MFFKQQCLYSLTILCMHSIIRRQELFYSFAHILVLFLQLSKNFQYLSFLFLFKFLQLTFFDTISVSYKILHFSQRVFLLHHALDQLVVLLHILYPHLISEHILICFVLPVCYLVCTLDVATPLLFLFQQLRVEHSCNDILPFHFRQIFRDGTKFKASFLRPIILDFVNKTARARNADAGHCIVLTKLLHEFFKELYLLRLTKFFLNKIDVIDNKAASSTKCEGLNPLAT